jgi:L-ribulose-5-phosphate 3-epimerase
VRNAIAVHTASFVARETGYAMHGWGHGDRMTNEAFAPIETFAERFDSLVGHVQELGFDAIDIWGAHLSPAWATDEHVDAARAVLVRRGMCVATYAPWIDASNVRRACEVAVALDVSIIGAGFAGDAEPIADAVREHGLRLAVENHPERTPAELLEKIARGRGVFGATVDTGWWATQGYDPAQAIAELGAHVLHVHLKDVLAEKEPHETCRFGEGIVDVRECVRALERIGYEGAISIEHEPETFDPSDDLRAMRTELEDWPA